MSARAAGREPEPDTDVSTVATPWQDDFSATRNALCDAARDLSRGGGHSRFALWLDSDETLESFPDLDWSRERAAWYHVALQDRADMTPRAATRLQRLDAPLVWQGAVHERLVPINGPVAEPAMLAGVLIVHHGYDDPALVASKIDRNRRLARSSAAATNDAEWALIAALTDARAAPPADAVAMWRRIFDDPAAQPQHAGAVDRRVEAAL